MMRCFVIILAVCSQAAAAEPDGFGVNKGLVLHLTFDKAGKQAIDKSPKKNHAAVHNAKFVEKGRFGGAFSLDGKGDYLRVPNSPSIEIRRQLTVAVWVKLHSFNPKGYANENGYIVNKGDDYWWNPAFGLGYSKGAHNALFHIGSPTARRTGIRSLRGVTKLQPGKWYHLVGAYDGAEARLYVNGKLEKTQPFKGLIRADKAPVLLGGGHLGSGEWGNQFTIDATIDSVMIWNRALGDDEVRSVAIGAPVGVPFISRGAKLDRVVLLDGKSVFFGKINNKRYVLTTRRGKIEIPASRVIGIVVHTEDKNDTLRIVLTDSQVLCGKLENQKLEIDMSGSKLSIPFENVEECGYRMSADRSISSRFSGTMVSLRDGQRLLLPEFKTKLHITTGYCKADLPPASIVMIRAADVQCFSHVVILRNGSRFSGVLGPKKWTARAAIGDKLEIGERQLLALTSGGVKSIKPAGGVTMKMLNGDTLYGKLTAKTIAIRTEFGEVSPDAAGVKSIVVSPKGAPPAVMTMWSGAAYRGRFADKQLSLALSPGGPTVKVSSARIASIIWTPLK
ncbi:MAG: LamG domain-containing protein [Phycisphaerae bacterium]|jgi:hypothetical protein|nr:LamG domain-containing protein [Phycisphaerae bacterium]